MGSILWGYNAMNSGESQPTFTRTCHLHPQGSKGKPTGLLFHPEEGADVLLRNVTFHSSDFTSR
jgi:hypothetical protein